MGKMPMLLYLHRIGGTDNLARPAPRALLVIDLMLLIGLHLNSINWTMLSAKRTTDTIICDNVLYE